MSEPTQDDRRDAGPTELAAFHAGLARLTPTPDGINMARLLFRAGQLSASRRSWAWPCATAASMMLAATLGSVLLLRPTPQPAERIVTVYVQPPTPPVPQPEPSTPSTVETPAPLLQASIPTETEWLMGESDYLQLRREVLANGVDALPPPVPWPAVKPSDNADTLLDVPCGSREAGFLRLKLFVPSGDAL